MDIQTRKIAFVEDFLKLQNEEVLVQLEDLLKRNLPEEDKPLPMSVAELNKRIDISEDDFKNNRYKDTAWLLAKYQG